MKWLLFCTFLILSASFVKSITDDEEDNNEVSDNEDTPENHELPEHEFVTEEKVVKSGKDKGKKKYTTTLMIPPHTFKRKIDKKVGQIALFTCNSCAKLGFRGISASALKLSESDDGRLEYELTRVPNDHRCVLSSTSNLKKKFLKALYDAVSKDPLKPIGKIYEQERTKFTSELDNEDDKLMFLSDIPNLKAVNPNLYRHRQQFIPKAPSTYEEFSVSHEWLKFNSEESIVIGDTYVIGGRVVVFACKESLKILSRAKGIGVDGTFSISPKLWTQVFIVTVEVTSEQWVPVAYAFLPDKNLDSYVAALRTIEQRLAFLGLELSASYSMSDFELNIRSALKEVFPKVNIRGCHFHFGQRLWNRVVDSGLKSDFSKKEYSEFAAFIRGAIGLSFVPLDRLSEALSILNQMSKQLKTRHQSFSKDFLSYINRYWINGNYHPSTWNFFQKHGVTTNNHAEGTYHISYHLST